jgi:adhesin/invasin
MGAGPSSWSCRGQFGNPVAGVKVSFTAPASGPGGSFAGKATATVITDANGVATAPGFTADNQAGTFTVAQDATRAHRDRYGNDRR